MGDETDDPLDHLVSLVAVATLPVAALAAIFVGSSAAGVVAIVGWLFLVPVLSILSDYLAGSAGATDESAVAATDDSETDPLDQLRERYAAGEIDEAEFERRLERLLETEGLEIRGDVDLDQIGPDTADSEGLQRERERELE